MYTLRNCHYKTTTTTNETYTYISFELLLCNSLGSVINNFMYSLTLCVAYILGCVAFRKGTPLRGTRRVHNILRLRSFMLGVAYPTFVYCIPRCTFPSKCTLRCIKQKHTNGKTKRKVTNTILVDVYYV